MHYIYVYKIFESLYIHQVLNNYMLWVFYHNFTMQS